MLWQDRINHLRKRLLDTYLTTQKQRFQMATNKKAW